MWLKQKGLELNKEKTHVANTCLMERNCKLITKHQLIMVVQIARRILYTCIRSVTNIYTERVKPTSCWRLERLDGKLSRAVLRGEEHGDVLPRGKVVELLL